MKKWMILVAMILLIATLTGCKPEVEAEEYSEVVALLTALPEEITVETEELIIQARALYDALPDNQKTQVSNYARLVQAETVLLELKEEPAYLEIITLIDALPEVIVLETEELVNQIRVLYDALATEEQNQVSNYLLLVEAEAMIESLKEEPAYLAIIQLIEDLPSVITLDNEEQITNIRTLFDALLLEEQTSVTNIARLVEAEEIIEQLKNPAETLNISGKDTAQLGEEIPLSLQQGENIFEGEVLWSSSDERRATVNQDGVVTVYASGVVVITAQAEGYEESIYSITVEAVDSLTEVLWWVEYHYENLVIDQDIQLPTKHPFIDSTIEWLIFDEHLLTELGVYNAPVVDEEIEVISIVTVGLEEDELYIPFLIKGFGTRIEAIALWLETQIPQRVSANVLLPSRHSTYGGTITWESSNQGVLTDLGTYTRPDNDIEVALNYVIQLQEETLSGVIYTVMAGKSDMQKAAEILVEFDELYANLGLIDKDLDLKTTSTITKYEYTITWRSDNEGVISGTGVFTTPLYDQNISLLLSIRVGEATITANYSGHVKGYVYEDIWEAVEVFLGNIYHETISNQRFILFGHEAGYERVPAQNIGYLPFYDHRPANVIVDLVPLSNTNRPGTIKTSTEYVVIHNTGMAAPTATAELLNRAIRNSNASWHYSIDDKDIYQHIPLDEVAWHAGDGSTVFGQTWTNAAGTHIGGGNRNGVGIEMAVYEGIDFNQSMRNSAKVTAELLVRYGLGFDRIKQHFNFSGKNCPQVLREGNRWEEFLNLVRIEYFAKVNLEGVEFIWTSLNPEIMDNTGRITNHPGDETAISYRVVVKHNGEEREYNFQTLLEKLG